VTISSNPDVEVAYRVILDDGYENEFFIPDDADVWCEKTLGFTNLAEIVGEAIENHFE